MFFTPLVLIVLILSSVTYFKEMSVNFYENLFKSKNCFYLSYKGIGENKITLFLFGCTKMNNKKGCLSTLFYCVSKDNC